MGTVCAACGQGGLPHTSIISSASTSTFQTGVNGYSGTTDGQITSQGGNDFTSAESLIAYVSSTPYYSEALIRFDGLSLPSGSQVTSASVTLTFEDYAGGNMLKAYYLIPTWSSTNVSWTNRDTGLTWNTPGAQGAGTDVVATAAFSDTSWTGTGDVTKTYTLDTATIQNWANTASSDNGLLLRNDQVADHDLRVHTSRDTTVSKRPLLTINYSTGTTGNCSTDTSGQWLNQGFAAQSGTFTAEYDATPSASGMDAVVGFTSGPQTSFTGLATIARFNTSGFIDARNGSAYAADVSIAYQAGTSYHFKFAINTTAHTYSVYVTPSGGTQQTLATNYAFRTEDNTVASLNNVTAYIDQTSGTLNLCNIQTSTADTTPPSVSMSAPASGATVSGTTVTVSATATDNVGVAGVQFLLDGQSLNPEVLAAPYQTSWNSMLVPNGSHTLSARVRDAAGNTATSSTVAVTVNNPTNCLSAGTNQWTGNAFPGQTSSYTAIYDATPSVSSIDAVVGMSDGAATAYSSLATITRFNTSGYIDVRNGANYTSDLQVAYSAGTTYHFRVAVNVSSRTYSVYVSSGGGSEQTIATNYAFRSDQVGSTLNTWDITTDTTGETITLCNFAISQTSGDTTPPSVTMTSPTNGNTYSGTIQLTANATDNVGVTGVQFLRDGASVGSLITSSPYTMSYSTTGLLNGSHTFSATAYDAAGNTSTATPVSVTINNTTNTAAHPRIWLDQATLTRLVGIAQSTDSTVRAPWDTLKNKCNSYGSVNQPLLDSSPQCSADPTMCKCEDYCNNPTVCCGYQGGYAGSVNDYNEAVLDLALCYAVGKGWDPTAGAWASEAVSVLTAMANYGGYNADNGYAIRNFPTAMAIAFDWLYDSPAFANIKSSVVTSLNSWLSAYAAQTPSYNFRQHPMSNYYAGYYAAQAYVALATDGDNNSAASEWTTFLGQQQSALGPHVGVADFYTKYVDGGGWPQGWEYGGLSTRNMIGPAIAALTAKNVDLIDDPTHPFHWALNQAMYILQFSWPSGTYMDDRGTIRDFDSSPSGDGYKCPGNAKIPTAAAEMLTSVLTRWPSLPALGPNFAQQFHGFVRSIRGYYTDNRLKTLPPWLDFLFWDNRASDADYTTLPMSYRATNAVAMRSAWNNSATWASLVSIGSMDWDQIEQVPDAGALVITRGDGAGGDIPFVVNAAFIDRCYYDVSGEMDESDFTNDFQYGNRDIFNVFMNGVSGEQDTAWVDQTPVPTLVVDQMEDKTGYVLVRANHLESVYASSQNINSWSRDVIYVRPNSFVVYDRTNAGSGDPHLNWHFSPTPALVSSGAAVRYNVADGSTFKGAMTTLLPTSAVVSNPPINLWSKNKLYRLEVRPQTAQTDMKWLTVFDASSSSSAVATASLIATSQVNGALLTTASGNTVVLFGNFGNPLGSQTIGSPMQYTEPAVATHVIITDLVPSANNYGVTVQSVGGTHTVIVTQAAGTLATSETGTLDINISAGGTVTPGS